MDEIAIEAIILAINALGCGILLFVSGIAQKMMDGMEPLEFKKFMNLLGPAATNDPFAVTIATIPLFAIVYYFIMFGFAHWWFTAGIVVWLIGTSITKIFNLPVYRWVGDPKNTDSEELKRQRRTLGRANVSRAWLTLLSVVLMSCQFSVLWTAVAVAACLVIALPTLWLSHWYFHNGPHR